MRIILVTDPPWANSANAKQMAELARRLQRDLHTVYWMPAWGFSDGGTLNWEGIEVLPGDDARGNHIIKHHAQATASHLIITRGDAAYFPEYGGSEFAWWAWHPGPVSRKILRKASRILAVSETEAGELERISGVLPFLVPRSYSAAYSAAPSDPQAVDTFRHNHGVGPNTFLLSAIGVNNDHWVRMLDAFKLFRDRHDDAMLYMHTAAQEPVNLLGYAREIGIPEGSIAIPNAYDYHRGYYDRTIAAMYQASAAHLVPGDAIQPMLEALACGAPVITTDRPEARGLLPLDGLGALVPAKTVFKHQPLLDVDVWAQEMENAYRMSVSEAANHRACCEMAVRGMDWDTAYERDWRPMLEAFEAEEKERVTKARLVWGQPEDKHTTAFLEDLGYVEEFGCEVVRKTNMGGNTQDEQSQNAIVQSWGGHPNIIKLLREGEDEFGRYYFDTPKLAPLKEIIRFTKEQADRILADIRAGLAFMHAHGAAHCDINPRNILLTDTKQVDGIWEMGPDMHAVIFDFDFMQHGLDPQIAYLCDFIPLHPAAIEYAVPVMRSGIATRGFHRVLTHVLNLPFDNSNATAHPDFPYQQIDGVGERDCGLRWGILKPEVAGKRVVDLGCNLGYFSARSLAEGAVSVEGYDEDAAMVKSAQVLHPELEGCITQMNFDEALPEGEYDVAFCMSVWQHLREGKRPMLDFLKRIPIVYWEDANFTKPDLEQLGFEVERLAKSERGRNLFKLTSRVREVANA